jgi:hypothetical protein
MSDKPEMQQTPGQRWMLALFLAQFLNFFTFAGVSGFLGGDGLNGKQEPGKYYVGSHGRYTAVSHLQYEFSRVQALTTMMLHIPAFICLALAAQRWKSKTRSMWSTGFSGGQSALILGLPAFWWGGFLIVRTV